MGDEVLQLPHWLSKGTCKGDVCQRPAMDTTWTEQLQRVNLLQSPSTLLTTPTAASVPHNRWPTCLSTMSTLCRWENSATAVHTHLWCRSNLGGSVHTWGTEQSPCTRLCCNRCVWSPWVWEMGALWRHWWSIATVCRLHQRLYKDETGSKRLAESRHDGRWKAGVHWSLPHSRWNRAGTRRTGQRPKPCVETNSSKCNWN